MLQMQLQLQHHRQTVRQAMVLQPSCNTINQTINIKLLTTRGKILIASIKFFLEFANDAAATAAASSANCSVNGVAAKAAILSTEL